MTIGRRMVTAIAVAVAFALLATGCSAKPGSGASKELNLGVTSSPTSLDPAQANEGNDQIFFQALYDPLIRRLPNGDLAPMLATKWTVSKDGLTITLKLRSDVSFSDGSHFDSSVVKANLDRFKTANGPQVATLSALASVDTPNATTAVLHLSKPDSSMLIYLSNSAGFMASAKALANPDLATKPDGSGPYVLDAATSPGNKYVFDRKSHYWGDKLPYDKITITQYPDEQSMLNALQSHQLNSAVFFDATSGKAAQDAGFKYWPNQTDYEGLVIFDRGGTKVPALGDVRVRQAINYAIDRQKLLSTFSLDRGTVTDQIWGPGSAGYDKGIEKQYGYDPAKAKQLLAEAGYPNGFNITMPTVPQFDPTMMAAVVQMLQNVGIHATLQDVPFSDFFTQLRAGQWPITYMRFFEPPDGELISQFISPDAVWNGFHTTDPKVESLLAQIAVAPEDQLTGPAQQLNRYIVDQAWFAPFYRVDNQAYSDANTVVQPQTQQAAPSLWNYSPKK